MASACCPVSVPVAFHVHGLDLTEYRQLLPATLTEWGVAGDSTTFSLPLPNTMDTTLIGALTAVMEALMVEDVWHEFLEGKGTNHTVTITAGTLAVSMQPGNLAMAKSFPRRHGEADFSAMQSRLRALRAWQLTAVEVEDGYHRAEEYKGFKIQARVHELQSESLRRDLDDLKHTETALRAELASLKAQLAETGANRMDVPELGSARVSKKSRKAVPDTE